MSFFKRNRATIHGCILALALLFILIWSAPVILWMIVGSMIGEAEHEREKQEAPVRAAIYQKQRETYLTKQPTLIIPTTSFNVIKNNLINEWGLEFKYPMEDKDLNEFRVQAYAMPQEGTRLHAFFRTTLSPSKMILSASFEVGKEKVTSNTPLEMDQLTSNFFVSCALLINNNYNSEEIKLWIQNNTPLLKVGESKELICGALIYTLSARNIENSGEATTWKELSIKKYNP